MVINITLFMVIAFFVSSCMGLNSPECFRKGLFYSQLDKISFPSLCHAALHICEVQFPLSMVSTILFFFTTCSLKLVPFQLPWLLLTVLGVKIKL